MPGLSLIFYAGIPLKTSFSLFVPRLRLNAFLSKMPVILFVDFVFVMFKNPLRLWYNLSGFDTFRNEIARGC